MKSGYFESYARVLSKTTHHTKAHDHQGKSLARTDSEVRSGRPVKAVSDQPAAGRMTDRTNGDG